MQQRTDENVCSRPWRGTGRALQVCAIAALVWGLSARIVGPSDLWDQTQPKTVSYTTDMLVNGGTHWILPVERGTLPATKPPMYNWLAAPMVKLIGFHSELAHKFPSIAAVCLCWAMLVGIGQHLGRWRSLGWLAAMIFVANYMMFKLGYLARPDMLLTLWLLIAWASATSILVRFKRNESEKPIVGAILGEQGAGSASNLKPQTSRTLVVGFWLSIACAGLTKGPAAIVGIAYGLVAARIIGGSWRAFGALRPMAGLPFCLGVVGLWLYGVWRIDPEHVRDVLWQNEILGRFTGTGPESNREGFHGWVRTLPAFGHYYLLRFGPWSLFSIAGTLVLWRGRRKRRIFQTGTNQRNSWLIGAVIYILLVIGLYTLSTSKRADYIASAFAPGSLLAAWWLVRLRRRLGRWVVLLAPGMAGLILLALTVVNRSQLAAPGRDVGEHINQFINQATVAMEREPLEVAFYETGNMHLQAMLGTSQRELERSELISLLRKRRPLWLIAGDRADGSQSIDQWLRGRNRPAQLKAMAQSGTLPLVDGWPARLTLWRVELPKAPRSQPMNGG